MLNIYLNAYFCVIGIILQPHCFQSRAQFERQILVLVWVSTVLPSDLSTIGFMTICT